MNELAHAVRALVANRDTACHPSLSNLSQLERTALKDLENLLSRCPQDLALKMSWPEEWMSPPSDRECAG